MGLPPEAIEAYLQKEAIDRGELSNDIEVFAENWDAVLVYQTCQWDIQPYFSMTMAGGASGFEYLGIRSTEVESGARACEVRFDAELLQKVRVMSHEAMKILNED
jgi:hypothetical protein